jgi:hypothetical protein
VMLLVHPTTNKWTVIATNPGAISCIIAFGNDGEMVPQAIPIAPRRSVDPIQNDR